VWPQGVKDAGVTKSDGAAYVPLPRNNAILRTPDDPEATLRYMVGAWDAVNGDHGSDGWYRIIAQAEEGPKLSWEWLMVDEEKPYASLFPDHIRERVAAALERDAGTAEWQHMREGRQQAEQEQVARVAELLMQYLSGQRARPALPEPDGGLRGRPPMGSS
jgi:hypothetical protein